MVLSIELDENIWVYPPGQTISGKVVITKPIWSKVEGLKLRIYGKVQRNSIYIPVVPELNRHPSHCVLDATIILLDCWKVLKPGRHEFPFTYQLPVNIPASFELNSGRLDYEFITTLKTPRDSFNVYQTRFFVAAAVDLRQYPDFYSPVEFTKNEFVGFLCCKNGSFGIKFKLDRSAYVPGEYVDFHAEIRNDSRLDLTHIKLYIVREFKLKQGKTLRFKENICELPGTVVPIGESHVMLGDLLQVPSIPATNTRCRDIFEINYFLKILLKPSPNSPIKISEKFAIMIGSTIGTNDEIPISSASEQSSQLEGIHDQVDQTGPPPPYDDVIADGPTAHYTHRINVTPREDFSPSAPLVENIEIG